MTSLIPDSRIETYDGVGCGFCGDVVLAVYQSDARLDRTRWLFDRVDEFVRAGTSSFAALLVIGESGSLPDAGTRAENQLRLRQLHGHLRKLVTVIQGDGLRLNLVRSLMRAMFLMQGQAQLQLIARQIEEGMEGLLREAGERTPRRTALETTLRTLSDAVASQPP